jgi:1,2-diacylglycerol 3-alpha-glucosyltransferase
MRIGLVADVYLPYVSGVTRSIDLLARRFISLGHDVTVFAFGDEAGPPSPAPPGPPGPTVVLSPPLFRHSSGFPIGLRLSGRARRLLAQMDVVHVQHPFLSGRLALAVCRRAHVPVVFTNHTRYDLHGQAYLPLLPASARAGLLRLYLGRFCRRVDWVVCPSEGMVSVLRDMGVDSPVTVIHNGVDIAPFEGAARPPGARRASRTRLGLPDVGVLFVYAGRLGPDKDLPLLLEAFSRLGSGGTDAGLVLFGDGPSRRELERMAGAPAAPPAPGAPAHGAPAAASRVSFSGMIAYDRLPDHLAACDVFVTPSVSEVHPLTIIEAMAAGLPAIGVSSPGVADLIENGRTGLVACRQAASELAALMERLATDAGLRESMGAAARVAARDYDIASQADALLRGYERLCDEAKLGGRRPSPAPAPGSRAAGGSCP